MIKLENIGKNEVIFTLNENISEYLIPYGNLSDNTYGEVVCLDPYNSNAFIVKLKEGIDYSLTNVYLFRDNVRIKTYLVEGVYVFDFAGDLDNFYYTITTNSTDFPSDINYGKLKITNENTLETKVMPSTSRFNLSLKNTQSLVEITDIPIFDISTNKTRYNKFNIHYDNTILKQFNLIRESKTLEPSKVYFIDGDVFINDESFLNIPTDTYMFYNDHNTLLIEGTVNNSDNIIPIDWTYVINHWFIFNNNSTYLFDFKPGYYDYEVKTSNNEMILESGRLLIVAEDENITYYASEDENIIYYGE